MAVASLKSHNQSERKVRLVARLVKGKKVPAAIAALTFLPKKAAAPMKKLIESAAASAKQQGQDPDTLTVAMAQRLVRKLCPTCREQVPITGADKDTLERLLRNIPHADELPANRDTMWIPKGCEKCGGLGYKGRVAVVEVILMDHLIEDTIRRSASERDIWAAARPQGIRRMAQDGAVKVLQSVTSLDELSRVVDLQDDVLLDGING